MCLHNFSAVCFLFDVAKATDEIDRQVYEYRGSMPICISKSINGEATDEIDRQVYEYRGSMPICISKSNNGESH